MLFLMGMFLLLLGAVLIAFPAVIYELTQSWKHGSASGPSERYVQCTRIEGAIFALVGAAGVVLQFV